MENHSHGWIEVIAGPMFCGKSTEIIRRLERCTIAKRRVQVFKPTIDTRYSVQNVASHAKSEFPATPVDPAWPDQILNLVKDGTEIVGIDEVQFFGPGIISVCKLLADKGIRVIAAGLNQTSEGLPFGPMADLMASADEVTVLTAICTECGAPATKSQRLVGATNGTEADVGAADKYAARCRNHFKPC